MEKFDKLRDNIEQLILNYKELKQENTQIKEKIERIEKNLNYFEGRDKEFPEVVLRNKKLINEREKIAVKIDGILKKLEEVKV